LRTYVTALPQVLGQVARRCPHVRSVQHRQSAGQACGRGAEMLLTPDGATVLLASAKHGNLITLSTNSPTVPGPALEISDAEGYSATLGASESKAPGTGERRTTSAASISLTDKTRKVIWSAP
jgi:hypothetical protein